MLNVNFQQTFWNIFLLFKEAGFDISCKLSPNVKLFSGKNKRTVNMLSAEIAHRVLNINFQKIKFWNNFLIFPRKLDLTFHENYLQQRQFPWDVKFCWLEKIRKVSSNILSAEIAQKVVKVRRTSILLLHCATFYLKMTHSIFYWITHIKPDSLSGVYYNDQSYSWPTSLHQNLTKLRCWCNFFWLTWLQPIRF